MATPVSLPNPIKECFKAGRPALGMLARLGRSGDISRIAKTTGHDFIMVDMQHALYNVETVGAIAQSALACGLAPIARVRSVDDQNTAVLLDNGIMGIVYPDVNTAEEAKRGVDRAKYPPIGRRSVAGGFSVFDFRALPATETVKALDDNTLVVCMIETPEGLANVDAIAAVPGVDVIHVGSSDLLTAMGTPGAYGTPEHLAALAQVMAAAKKHGKIAGVGGDRNIPRQVDFIRQGARFLTTNSDIAMLLAEGKRVTGELRKALGEA